VINGDDILYNDNHGDMSLATTDGLLNASSSWLTGGGNTGFDPASTSRLIGDSVTGTSAYVNFVPPPVNFGHPASDSVFEHSLAYTRYESNVIIFG